MPDRDQGAKTFQGSPEAGGMSLAIFPRGTFFILGGEEGEGGGEGGGRQVS